MKKSNLTMRIYKKVDVDSAHRHLHHEGKCGKLHGHRWIFEVRVEGEIDKETGMVVDFGDIKKVIEEIDHAVLMNEKDPLADILEEHGQKVFRLPFDPTAENLSIFLKKMLREEMEKGEELDFSISAWETPKNKAEI